MNFPVTTPSQLGAILRGFRQQRDLTQAELASRLGIPQKAISLAETHPEKMGVHRLFALLGALQVKLLLQDRAQPKGHKGEW